MKFAEKGSNVEEESVEKTIRFDTMFEYASRSQDSSRLRLEEL